MLTLDVSPRLNHSDTQRPHDEATVLSIWIAQWSPYVSVGQNLWVYLLYHPCIYKLTASLAWMHPVIVPQLLSFKKKLFRYAAMCDCILVYTIAMPVCTCCLSVAHTCFSLSVIVVFLFAPDSLGLCTYCTIFLLLLFFFCCCNV